MIQKEVEFTITYFKSTGKYYTDVKYKFNTRICETDNTTVYMYDIIDHIKKCREGLIPQGLPGISSKWKDGFILIDCEDGFPHLLKPIE